MFGLLKKKISSFIDQLTQKEEQKGEPEQPLHAPQPQPLQPPEPQENPAIPRQPEFQTKPTPTPPDEPRNQSTTSAPTPTKPPEPVRSIRETITPPAPKPRLENQKAVNPSETQNSSAIQPIAKPSAPQDKPEPSAQPEPKKERKLEAKLGLFSQVKSFFVKEIQIQESELEPMLEELQLALLESDVTLDTADHITTTLKEQLAGKKVEKQRVQEEIKNAVHATLSQLVNQQPLDLVAYIQTHEKPVKILFLGPNGAGKTTTIAKTAFYLRQNGASCVLAAADTFRAAAIEQLQHHGEKIGVNVIAHQYGSDPSAVAFDAIAHAQAKKLDAVLIDTAGRQETNYNLLKEMEKINRVVNPDLKLFVGEAVAGHALVEQAKAFHVSLKLDGVILTKVDCDAKGGTSFSVAHEVGVPIVLVGVGQEYGDLKPFDAAWLVSNVLAE
ncbi:signal recognition particle-docking protein FtsY [Candidatus Micrarchaeota archaeon]|nr:signal recognition particle-docking protein FtsY [Candidatus Micrarchaeota archaeon]